MKFLLQTSIHHSGTLNRGHYWAFIKDLHSSFWYFCNDKTVFNVEENSVNSTTSYILLSGNFNFFQDLPKTFMVLQGDFVISDIVFGCDNPTCNPIPVRELSLLTQFSGITTLQTLVSEKQCKGVDLASSCL